MHFHVYERRFEYDSITIHSSRVRWFHFCIGDIDTFALSTRKTRIVLEWERKPPTKWTRIRYLKSEGLAAERKGVGNRINGSLTRIFDESIAWSMPGCQLERIPWRSSMICCCISRTEFAKRPNCSANCPEGKHFTPRIWTKPSNWCSARRQCTLIVIWNVERRCSLSAFPTRRKCVYVLPIRWTLNKLKRAFWLCFQIRPILFKTIDKIMFEILQMRELLVTWERFQIFNWWIAANGVIFWNTTQRISVEQLAGTASQQNRVHLIWFTEEVMTAFEHMGQQSAASLANRLVVEKTASGVRALIAVNVENESIVTRAREGLSRDAKLVSFTIEQTREKLWFVTIRSAWHTWVLDIGGGFVGNAGWL